MHNGIVEQGARLQFDRFCGDLFRLPWFETVEIGFPLKLDEAAFGLGAGAPLDGLRRARVGAITNTRVPRRGLAGCAASFVRMGRVNAAVLPVPVWAMPIRSCPARMGGMAAVWMGVGSV